MDRQFLFETDTATVALFDPDRLGHRGDDEADWWCADLAQLDEVRSGVLALAGLGGDGVYRVRITDGDLTADERDYAAGVVRGLGVEVVSGQLFAGPAECLPGGGGRFAPDDAERGLLLDVDRGPYDVDLFAINWPDSPRWWREDDSVPDDAPADLVAVLRRRSAPFTGPDAEPHLASDEETFLFESTSRRVGPEPGMILTTKVRRGPSNELVLKECGPRHYQASLVDSSMVAWKDTIRFRVVSVDHEAKRLTGEFIERLEGPREG